MNSTLGAICNCLLEQTRALGCPIISPNALLCRYCLRVENPCSIEVEAQDLRTTIAGVINAGCLCCIAQDATASRAANRERID